MAVVPTFVSVTVFGVLVTPIATVPKFSVVGASFAAVPVPDNVTFCGLPLALSVMLIAALRAPVAVGLKCALTVQLAPAASDAPQVVAVLAKSPALVPVIAIELMVRELAPEFLTVTVLTALVTPTGTVPKAKLVGVKVTAGPSPDERFTKTVSKAKSGRTQLVSPEPHAVKLKVTEVILGPV